MCGADLSELVEEDGGSKKNQKKDKKRDGSSDQPGNFGEEGPK